MADIICCGGDIKNLGVPKSVKAKLETRLITIFAFATDGAGNPNRIDLNDTLDQAYFDAKVSEADPLKRWYVAPAQENNAGERAASTYDTANSGRRVRRQRGLRTVQWELWEHDTYMVDKLESFECRRGIVEFYVDACGNLHGDVRREEGYVYGVPVADDSLEVLFMEPNTDTASKIQVSYDYDQRFRDGSRGYITAESIAIDLTLDLKSPVTVLGEVSDVTTAGLTIAIRSDFGGTSGTPITDFTTEFEFYNETQAAVEPYTLTETADGEYAIVWDTPTTSGDILEPRIASGVTGFDDSELRELSIVTP